MDWHGDLAPKLWAVLSGFGWAAGTVAVKYFQRDHELDMLKFITWQMALGVLPLTLLPGSSACPRRDGASLQALLLFIVGVVATARRIPRSGWKCCAGCPRERRRSTCFAIPVIALLSSMAVFGERLAGNEWAGIALIGAGLALITALALAGGRRASLLRPTRHRSKAAEGRSPSPALAAEPSPTPKIR